MNDENIAQLIVELDKLSEYVPPGNTFTIDWLENEYSTVTAMRCQGKLSYRNEYRIIKILIESLTKVLVNHRDKLVLLVLSFKIIKSIEDALKEEFNSLQHAKMINSDLEKNGKYVTVTSLMGHLRCFIKDAIR
ncbi:hypothetical protein ACJMK2_001647 [Sinanodonta woodiana]|uniref:Uncharacterized protein n=1 Tax=Sinanodonta woodiana TaxID=1069815 RepID=A0ABD3XW88_SINWO